MIPRPSVVDPVGAGATRYRTETAKRLLDEVTAEVRGVESVAAGGGPVRLANEAARALGLIASVTGPVDHLSDGEVVVRVANGRLAAAPEAPLAAATATLVALGVASEDAAVEAKGPGHLPRGPRSRDARRAGPSRSGRPGRGAGAGRARSAGPT